MRYFPLYCAVLAVLFSLSSLAVSWATERDASNEPKQQAETFDELQRYLSTSDWKLRKEIAEADGEAEILASRIFRAFDAYCIKGISYEEKRESEKELERNPKLTLSLLRPILKERMTEEEMQKHGGASYPPVDPSHVDTYFNFCIRFAAVEHDGYAMDVLSQLCNDRDSEISEKALESIRFVNEEWNYRFKSELYKKRKNGDALKWLAKHYLSAHKVSGLSLPDVEDVLGPADYPNSLVWIGLYDGVSGTTKRHLRLSFFDGQFESWEWGEQSIPIVDDRLSD
jgi:hypothetical protein